MHGNDWIDIDHTFSTGFDFINEAALEINQLQPEDYNTDLPQRIMNALRAVAGKILKLQQDKNGDYVY